MLDGQPLNKTLSGLPLEYRLIELYSRDVGRREAKLVFDVGQGTQDLGFRNEVNILFDCEPAVEVTLEVLDDDGQPTTGHFVFRDMQRPGLSVAVAPAGARLLLSRADLSPQRRERHAAAGQVSRHVRPRPGVSRARAARSTCPTRSRTRRRFASSAGSS